MRPGGVCSPTGSRGIGWSVFGSPPSKARKRGTPGMSLRTLDFAQGEGVADGVDLVDVPDFQEDSSDRGDKDGRQDAWAPPHPDARYRAHVPLVTRPRARPLTRPQGSRHFCSRFSLVLGACRAPGTLRAQGRAGAGTRPGPRPPFADGEVSGECQLV